MAVAELAAAAPPASLIAYAAAKRYAIETGGAVLNGLSVASDRDTQAKLSGAVLAY